MKKLIFCFDGTWNDIKASGERTSNVAKFAAMLDNVDDKGNPQIIHYDTGVGTGRRGRLTEGATGKRVLENIREAYLNNEARTNRTSGRGYQPLYSTSENENEGRKRLSNSMFPKHENCCWL